MRICLYTDTALPKIGGQEMVVDALARQFQTLGHDVVVLAQNPRLPLRPRDGELPYRVVRHPRFFSTKILVAWYRWFLNGLHRRQRTDLLHCHGVYPPGFLAALTKEHRGIPTVITSHGGDVHPNNVRLAKPAIHARVVQGLQAADALVAISRFTEENFRRLCPGAARIVSIPNGVDVGMFAERVERPAKLDAAIEPGNYFLFLGRLANRKGVDVLLQALAQWQPSGPQGVQLVLAGDGDERAALQQLSASLNLGDRVRFVGPVFREAKAYLLQNACCTVMPSRVWEAFPLVVLESYASGTPVLGTRIAGLEDLIEPGVTGWLTPPEAPAAMARLLAEIWENRSQLQNMRRQALDVARRHDWQAIARRHLKLYGELLEPNRPSVTITRVQIELHPNAADPKLVGQVS